MPDSELIRLQLVAKTIASLTSKNSKVWYNSSDNLTMTVQSGIVAQFYTMVRLKALIFQGTTIISLLEHR